MGKLLRGQHGSLLMAGSCHCWAGWKEIFPQPKQCCPKDQDKFLSIILVRKGRMRLLWGKWEKVLVPLIAHTVENKDLWGRRERFGWQCQGASSGPTHTNGAEPLHLPREHPSVNWESLHGCTDPGLGSARDHTNNLTRQKTECQCPDPQCVCEMSPDSASLKGRLNERLKSK